MLIDSNIIIYSAKSEYGNVSDFAWIEGLELINPFDSPPDKSSPDS